MQRSAFQLALTSALLLFPLSGLAQTYRHELTFHSYETTDNFTLPESSGDALSYTYFFADLGNSELPLAELEFGSRVSNLGIAYSQQDRERRSANLATGHSFIQGESISLTTVFGEYKHNSGWFLSGSYADGKAVSRFNEDKSVINLTAGIYLTDFTTLSITGTQSKDDQEYIENAFCGWGGSGLFTCYDLDQEQETRSYNLAGRHLRQLGGRYYAFGLNYKDTAVTSKSFYPGFITPNYETTSEASNYGVSLTAYWNRNFSTGIYLSNLESDESVSSAQDIHQAGIELEYFIFTQLSISIDYTRVSADARVTVIPGSIFTATQIEVKNNQEIFWIGLKGRF